MRFKTALLGFALLIQVLASAAQKGVPQMVDAGGYRLSMLIEGEGSRAVVFVNGGFGGPDATREWDSVRVKVNEFARTVVYDRGGTGKSEPAPPPRDSNHISSELHTALRAAGVEPPYVLVGHSMGGIHMRVFAHMYPSEIAGLVFIDPTSEDFDARLKAGDPEMWKKFQTEREEMTRQISRAPQGIRYEVEAIDADVQQARESWPLPAAPVVLFSSMHLDDGNTAQSRAIWLELHKEFLKRVPGSKHIVTEKSGHAIHKTDPELIAAAIREIVNASTSGPR